MQFHTNIVEKIKTSTAEILTLDLNNYGFLDEHLEELTKLIKQNTYVKSIELNLRRNNIDDEGIGILRVSKLPIKVLDLSDNDVSDESAKFLATSAIKYLDLSHNNFSSVSAEILWTYAKQLYLNVEGNDISEEEKEKIAERVQSNNADFLKRSLGLMR